MLRLTIATLAEALAEVMAAVTVVIAAVIAVDTAVQRSRKSAFGMKGRKKVSSKLSLLVT